jgi:hypothetical protein
MRGSRLSLAMCPEKAARRLHLTPGDFQQKLPELFDRGFPRPDPTTGMFDLETFDQWRRSRYPRIFRLTEDGGARLPPRRTARDGLSMGTLEFNNPIGIGRGSTGVPAVTPAFPRSTLNRIIFLQSYRVSASALVVVFELWPSKGRPQHA